MLAIAALLAFLVVGVVVAGQFGRTTSTETLEVPAPDVSTLAVSGEAGDVTIVAEDRADISITTTRTSTWLSGATSDVEETDGSLSVKSGCDGDFIASSCSVDHEIHVPTDAIDDLALSLAAGQVEIVGTSADVTVDANAGGVRLLEFAGDTARLNTRAGRVEVEASTAPRDLAVTTDAGEVEIVVPDEVYDVVAETRVGAVDVDVRRADDADREITVATQAGRISITTR